MFFEHSVKLDPAFSVGLVLKSSITLILEQSKHLKRLLLVKHPFWRSKWISGQTLPTALWFPLFGCFIRENNSLQATLKKKLWVKGLAYWWELQYFCQKEKHHRYLVSFFLSPVSYLSITCLVSILHWSVTAFEEISLTITHFNHDHDPQASSFYTFHIWIKAIYPPNRQHSLP